MPGGGTEGPWRPEAERGRSRSRPRRGPSVGVPGRSGGGRGAARALRAAGGAAGRARQPRLPSGLALMKTRTLLPLGTRWDGSAERLPENAARRSAASRGQGSLPPAPAGHIPPRRRASRRLTAAPGAPRRRQRLSPPAEGQRPYGPSGCPGPPPASAAARLGLWPPPGAGARGQRGDEAPTAPRAAPLRRPAARRARAEKFAVERCRARRRLRRDGGPAAAAGPPAPPGRPRPPRRAAGGCAPGARSGRRVPPVPPPPARVCGVQSGDASGEADGSFVPSSVSQPRDRIFIGKLLPAHPLGSEEFRALLVFRNLLHRSPTCSDTKERCSCFFFLSFVFNQLFIYRNK